MGVTPELYLESLCSGLSFIDFIANSRSGQFFFYSFDGVFMIKTVRQDEKDFLLRLLPGYYKHLLKHALRPGADEATFFPNGNASLLTRFYGLHCTRLRHLRRKVHFVVMSSIYGANTSSRMVQFDLKGSLYNRGAKREDKVLKDRDLTRLGTKLRVSKDKADALLDSAKHDAVFLARHGVMDYSLLVGIYRPDTPPGDAAAAAAAARAGDSPRGRAADGALSEYNSRHFSRLPSSLFEAAQVAACAVDRDRARSSVAPRSDADLPPAAFDVAIEGTAADGARELYYLGIIDILQEYTLRKHVETDVNILKRGLRKYKECSCVPPAEYADRFLAFISRELF